MLTAFHCSECDIDLLIFNIQEYYAVYYRWLKGNGAGKSPKYAKSFLALLERCWSGSLSPCKISDLKFQ